MRDVNITDVLNLQLDTIGNPDAEPECRDNMDVTEQPENDYFEFSEDESEREIQTMAVFLEQRQHQEEQEISAAVSFARDLMKHGAFWGNFFQECASHIGEHRKRNRSATLCSQW